MLLRTNKEWAIAYAALGWLVFPLNYVRKDGTCSCGTADCNRIGKHPIGRLAKTGLKVATCDVNIVESWWSENPHYNIGHATGKDGEVVMDVDSFGKNKATGLAKAGPVELAKLESQFGMLPETLRAKTGGGGVHFYFKTDHEIKNSQNLVAEDIDVRGLGGYVILPPSNHVSGGKYEWCNWDIPVATLPSWLDTRMVARPAIEREEIQPEVKREAEAAKLGEVQILRLLDFINPDCDRDTWWKVGAALKSAIPNDKRAFEAWRAWSLLYKTKDGSKGWNEVTGEAQWRSFVDKGITAGTLVKLATDGGFRGFDREAAAAPEIVDNWVYVVGVKRFVELGRLLELDAEQYDAQFSPLFSRGKASANTLKNEEFRRLDAVTFAPSQPRICSEDGFTKLNYWHDPKIEPIKGDVAPLLDHVAYMLPDPEEANILLDYFAFQAQHPGKKVHWSILLQGVPGSGKSFFGEMMKRVLGPPNVRSVTNEMLHENFTNWLKNCQFVIVEEMMAGKRLELMNKLKPMITEGWLSIREMYKPPFEIPNRLNFLFLTNHMDSIIIDKTDRRYCILASPAEPKEKEYYGPLFAWMKQCAPVVLRYLLDRNLSNFAPHAHAPMTKGKEEVIAESMMDLDHFISSQISACAPPFHYDLVMPSSMVKVLGEYNNRCTTKQLERALHRLGCVKLNNDIWTVRNAESYRQLDLDKLRQILGNQAAGGPKETPGADLMVDVRLGLKRDMPI